MPRPKLHENLKNTTLSLESEIIEECKKRNINISEVCRLSLLQALGDPIIIKKYDKFSRVTDDVKKIIKETLKKDQANVQGCLRILKRHTGINFGAIELLEWFDRNKESD